MNRFRIYLLLAFLSTAFSTRSFSQAYQSLPDTIINGKHFIPASFPGGVDGWRSYLEKNLHYPKKAYKNDIQGTAKIEMTVDEKGKVTKTRIVTDPGAGLGDEARRVIKDGPKWAPATEDGLPVLYTFIQNIIFQLQ